MSTGVVIVGTQWGDEGKGKIVDYIADTADIVIRFQGGHNAGHTVINEGMKSVFHLLPCGVLRPVRNYIGNGVVVSLEALVKELDQIKTPIDLTISPKCPVILPYHIEMDRARETNLGGESIGTTGRGIGPVYEDKVSRRAVRLGDLFNMREAKLKIIQNNLYYKHVIEGFYKKDYNITVDEMVESIEKLFPIIRRYIGDVTHSILGQLHHYPNSLVLYEGAQGIHLDVDHGTYPYVTSSNTLASNAGLGSGLSTNHLDELYVVGITKAYTTRVGSGPFPTELFDETGQKLAMIGKEVGATTGRPRRCGWFDAALVRKSIELDGIDSIILTKLDVLDSFEDIKICVGYDGVIPRYITLPGWTSSTEGLTSYDDLPDNAKKYINAIEKICNTNICAITTGPDRKHVIMIDPVWQMLK